MAGDWIKMRTDLATSPKVVRLSSALKADRFRIIGGLHSAWCLFDAHSEDGILTGYTPAVLDDLIGWPGFAAAMIAVSWLEDDGQNLILPRFEDHNGLSAKRRAQDADRKRVLRMSASETDINPKKVFPREEESREEEAKEKKAPAKRAVEYFPDVDPEIASAYAALRKRLRAPLSDIAVKGLRREAGKAGMTIEAVLTMCCERSWRGFSAEWISGKANGAASHVQIPAGGGRQEL